MANVSDRSRNPLRLFVQVWRKFGFRTAGRVSYFRVRGRVFPKLALADPHISSEFPFEVSLLLDASEQDPQRIAALLDDMAERVAPDWEICICVRGALLEEAADALAGRRELRARLRIVECAPADAGSATQWTVEQATGRFIALVPAAHDLSLDRLAVLKARLDASRGADTAVWLNDAGACEMLLQRKASYIAGFDGCWPLLADQAHQKLRERAAAVMELRGG